MDKSNADRWVMHRDSKVPHRVSGAANYPKCLDSYPLEVYVKNVEKINSRKRIEGYGVNTYFLGEDMRAHVSELSKLKRPILFASE